MKSLLAMIVFALSLTAAPAQKKGSDYVRLSKTEFEGGVSAGSRVTVRLYFKIEPGFHTQSHKPSEKYFIPTVFKFDDVAGIKAGAVKYPEGTEEKVEGLDKPVSIYEEDFVISVPLAISGQVKLPATLSGMLTYQACKGASCFPPQKLKVSIEMKP
jgi:hypothetical protein